MKKKELLVPVGTMEALHQAIHNGADAVYLGGKQFGARKFADNFSEEEMIEAISLCHLYGVKIYVTVNTLIYDEEVESFLEYIKFLYLHHVDAVIMQDFGMICLVRECFPDLEIHASTQMHNQNQQGLSFLQKLGIKRAVLARELSLDEIETFDVDMELEVFVHGALCICYSGCCLFSSMVGGRSGNRGECAGSCRLPYQLLEDGKVVSTEGKYLLSPKELNTSRYFARLMESNITSFKIEGRMKSPAYVGLVTKFYRNLIDQYEQNKKIVVSQELEDELKTLFHRQFTKGYLFQEDNHQLMNIKSPNHIGVKIGRTIEVTSSYIKIELDCDLVQGDGIRFLESGKGMIVNFLYDQNHRLIHEAKRKDVVFLDNKIQLTSLDQVRKTKDVKLLERLEHYEKRRIAVDFHVVAKKGQSLKAMIMDGVHCLEVEGAVVQKAKNAPLSEENIIAQFRKLGNTPFVLDDITVEMDDDIFLPIQSLNQLRRELTLQLEEKRRTTSTQKTRVFPMPQFHGLGFDHHVGVSILVRNQEQLEQCLQLSFQRIYVDDWKLFQKYQNDPRIYYEMPRVGNVSTPITRLLMTQLSGFEIPFQSTVCDYTMNVTNSYTVYYLQKYGASIVTLSPELTDKHIQTLLASYRNNMQETPHLEKIIYGRIDLMIMKHCILNDLLANKDPCSICKNGKTYQLKDRMGQSYPIVSHCNLTHILSSIIDQISSIPLYWQMGISSFRLQLFDETKEEIENLYRKIEKMLKK